MNKKLWDIYAPIYEKAMRGDRKAYGLMYERIPKVIQGKDVLEVATGPGLLAKHVAHAAHKMIAADYSDGMIKEAKKGSYPDNLTFEVADAEHLPYTDDSFDAVIIANALHIVPNPQKALREIDRVLKEDGLLIAPNFVNHKKGAISAIWSKIIRIAGVKLEHQWSTAEYRAFLEANGWNVVMLEEMSARITLAYAECVKREKNAGEGNANYPETKDIVGPQMFGYNKKAHIVHFIVYIPVCAALALGCGVLFS